MTEVDPALAGWQDMVGARPTSTIRQLAGLVKVRDLMNTEIESVREDSANAAEGDVRCTRCELRYAERHEYGCRVEGEPHYYDEDERTAAREAARAEPVEHVTLAVADIRAALGLG